MGLSGGVAFVIALVVILVLLAAGWVAFTHLRARRLGLPTPTLASYNPFASRQSPSYAPRPATGGLVGWVNDKIRAYKSRNDRTAGGAYEEPLNSVTRGRGANRGFGPLDPDDAWDARVGTEADAYGPGAYDEEHEVGLHGNDFDDRGRARNFEPEPYIGGSKKGLDTRYDEETGNNRKTTRNPFDDDAEASNVSLRGVSPRPAEGGKAKSGHKRDDSPTERRSVFQENIN